MQIQVVDYQDPASPARFVQSLKETGFGVIENHTLDQDLIDRAYEEWYAFFSSDKAEKEKFLFDQANQEGFIPFSLSETAKGSELKDIKEFYHYYPWGRCPDHLKALTQELYQQMSLFAETLLQWVQAHTPSDIVEQFSMPLNEMIKDSRHTLFRILHYPPLVGDEQPGAIRAAAHEDINLLTVLPAATAEGLQVKDKTGQWMDVPCNAKRIIINVGDMLTECTNGYFKATTHRVINPVGEKAKQSRLSMPLFLHPRNDVRLSARHTAKSYLHERLCELGLATAEAEG